MVGIYKITSPSGKIYIGQSINIEKRKKTYKYFDTNCIGPKISNSIKKYGWENHTHEVLEECEKDKLYEKENYWKVLTIEKYGWENSLFCNLHDVGSNGPLSNHIKQKLIGQKRTEKTKQKMREAKIGKPSSFKGKKHNPKSKQKMREAKIGKPSNRKKTPILQYDLDMNLIKEWDSISILKENGFSSHSIIRTCNKVQKTSYKHIWKYK
tara:strand:+ start:91 stop:720 length:630 start_codon:yes stop_codon:yes gene_type:complete